jgi:hypothetical protein
MSGNPTISFQIPPMDATKDPGKGANQRFLTLTSHTLR